MAGPGTLQGGRERSRPDAERPHDHEEPVLSLIGLLGFATVVLLAVLLLHGYLWWRLVRSTTLPGRTRRLLTLCLVVVALLPVGAVVLRRQDSLLSTVVQWVGFSWLGVAFYLFLTLLALEPVRLLLRERVRSVPDHEAEPVVASGARRAPRSGDQAARRRRGRHVDAGVVRRTTSAIACAP